METGSERGHVLFYPEGVLISKQPGGVNVDTVEVNVVEFGSVKSGGVKVGRFKCVR